MKKYLWTSAAVIAAFCLAFAACGGGGGNPEGQEDEEDTQWVLFEGGVWDEALGTVTTKSEHENDAVGGVKPPDTVSALEQVDGQYSAPAGDFTAFYFEKPIDVSDYTKLIVELASAKGVEYWSGGQLFFYDATGWKDKDDETQNLAKFGYWKDTVGKNKVTQTFSFSDKTIQQDFPSKVVAGEDVPDPELDMADCLETFAGFRSKGVPAGADPYVVKKIYLVGGKVEDGGEDEEEDEILDPIAAPANGVLVTGGAFVSGITGKVDFGNFYWDAEATNSDGDPDPQWKRENTVVTFNPPILVGDYTKVTVMVTTTAGEWYTGSSAHDVKNIAAKDWDNGLSPLLVDGEKSIANLYDITLALSGSLWPSHDDAWDKAKEYPVEGVKFEDVFVSITLEN